MSTPRIFDPEPGSCQKSALTRRAPEGRREPDTPQCIDEPKTTRRGRPIGSRAATARPASDILHQYEEIGAFLRITPKQAEHRSWAGEILTFKLGRIVCARKSTLLAWMAEQEAKSARRGGEPHEGASPSDMLEVQLDRIEVVLVAMVKRIEHLEKEMRHGQRS